MPNTASAAKQARSSLRRQIRNRSATSYVHSIQKTFLATLSSGKKDEAKALYPKVVSILDKAAKRGLIHRNAADRRKSRLAARLKAAA
jgi:small subunit ribosomal protein S20